MLLLGGDHSRHCGALSSLLLGFAAVVSSREKPDKTGGGRDLYSPLARSTQGFDKKRLTRGNNHSNMWPSSRSGTSVGPWHGDVLRRSILWCSHAAQANEWRPISLGETTMFALWLVCKRHLAWATVHFGGWLTTLSFRPIISSSIQGLSSNGCKVSLDLGNMKMKSDQHLKQDITVVVEDLNDNARSPIHPVEEGRTWIHEENKSNLLFWGHHKYPVLPTQGHRRIGI